MRNYTQAEIDNLIGCPKTITTGPRREMALERGQFRNEFLCETADGLRFSVFLRKNAMFEENFSIGLEHHTDSGAKVILLRCNGPHGEHLNGSPWSSDHPHFGRHIHMATSESIADGLQSEKHATITDQYATFDDALAFLVLRCNIQGADKYFPALGTVRQLSFLQE